MGDGLTVGNKVDVVIVFSDLVAVGEGILTEDVPSRVLELETVLGACADVLGRGTEFRD